MRTFANHNLYVNFLTRKNNLPHGNYLYYLMINEITIQRPFELTDIDYDRIKDGISSM